MLHLKFCQKKLPHLKASSALSFTSFTCVAQPATCPVFMDYVKSVDASRLDLAMILIPRVYFNHLNQLTIT